jgi:hypothetical protein
MHNLDLFADLEEVVAPEAPAAPEVVEMPASVLTSVAVTAPVAVPAAPAAPAVSGPSKFGREAHVWAEAAIEDLAAKGGVKTRLGALKENTPAYALLVEACLTIAMRKHEAYTHARTSQETGGADRLTGWVTRDPELAEATGRFTRNRLALNELEMLPAHLLLPMVEHENPIDAP